MLPEICITAFYYELQITVVCSVLDAALQEHWFSRSTVIELKYI